MKTIYIVPDEMYPVYIPFERGGKSETPTVLTDEEWEYVQDMERQFELYQDFLRAKLFESPKPVKTKQTSGSFDRTP